MVTQLPLFELEAARPPDVPRVKLEYRSRSQVLSKPTGPLAVFDYSLNPYVGCGFGCEYCYASFFQADQAKFDSWGEWVDAKVGAVETLLRTKNLRGKRVYMSSATDPYQPIEAKLCLTRRIVEALSDSWRQPRLVVQTRGPLVVRDIDLLSRFESLRVNVSITTDSEDIRKAFEPACASIDRRLEAVARLHDAGIRTSVSIAPMLPIENPAKFAARILETGADCVGFGYFHLSDRPFTASTRPRALELARAMGWCEAAYRRTRGELERHLGPIADPKAWKPA